MPISERWKKFPASRLSRFAIFTGFGLGFGSIYLIGFNLKWFFWKSPTLYEFIQELSLGLFVVATSLVMFWIYDQGARGDITRSQRDMLLCMSSLSLPVWVFFQLTSQSVYEFTLCITLVLAWESITFLASLIAYRATRLRKIGTKASQ